MNTDNRPTQNDDDSYRDTWKQAFDEAAETPPPRVWSAIERQLEKDDRARVIPLWAQVRPWATGIAATVAIVLTGWWAWQELTPSTPIAQKADNQSITSRSENNKIETARKEAQSSQSSRTETNQRTAKPATQPDVARPDYQDRLVASAPAKLNRVETPDADVAIAPVDQGKTSQLETTLTQTKTSRVVDSTERVALAEPETTRESAVSHSISINSEISKISTGYGHRAIQPQTIRPTPTDFGPTSLPGAALSTESVSAGESERLAVSVGELVGKPFRNRQLTIQRVVWFRNDDQRTVEPEQSTPAGRETWASVSVMPSSFNPAVAVQLPPGPSSYNSFALAANRIAIQTPSLRSESGGAVTVQVSAGTQFNDRWSVETGVGYLQARSTVISPVQSTGSVANLDSRADQTLYTAVIQSNISRNASPAQAQANNIVSKDQGYDLQPVLYNSPNEGRTRSDYRFVQIPMQVGYQLRPRRKLGLSVLGGLLTNWFVRNTVGETLSVKPSDDIYRSLTLAGTAGVRFRYRSSRRWSASVAGVYQQALQGGTQSGTSLETHPYSAGLSFGVDYHF
ncbi:MAG: hypothetical protein H7Z72_16895 [Bacteroidetes bacterium]|nr:hypothetical protein [Fibrella sp.]